MSPCSKCGEPTERVIELEMNGDVAEFPLCDGCEDGALKRFREAQRQFQFLIDNGVSRARANAIMIRRIEAQRIPPPPPPPHINHPNCRCWVEPTEDE